MKTIEEIEFLSAEYALRNAPVNGEKLAKSAFIAGYEEAKKEHQEEKAKLIEVADKVIHYLSIKESLTEKGLKSLGDCATLYKKLTSPQ